MGNNSPLIFVKFMYCPVWFRRRQSAVVRKVFFMPSKNTKSKPADSDAKTKSGKDEVFAGGNPKFDERKPTSPGKTGGTVHAGVNPDFDERRTEK